MKRPEKKTKTNQKSKNQPTLTQLMIRVCLSNLVLQVSPFQLRGLSHGDGRDVRNGGVQWRKQGPKRVGFFGDLIGDEILPFVMWLDYFINHEINHPYEKQPG